MKKEKQIEEMAKEISAGLLKQGQNWRHVIVAEHLYNAGCRKQSEGEWKIKSEIHQMFDDVDEELYVECPFCKRTFWVPYEFDDEKTFEYAREHYPYCNCGARMGGSAE